MSISTVGLNNQNTNVTDSMAATKSLGLDEFLLILTTELSQQNPLDPLSSRDFIAQTAQFASLNQLKNFNVSLENLSGIQQMMNNALTTSLIGKEVKAQTNSINLKENESAKISYELESDVNNVTIEIYNDKGVLVKTIEAGPQNSGEQNIEWDGKDEKGIPQSSGNYSYKIKVQTEEKGEAVEIHGYVKGVVTGVNFKYGQPYLVVDGQSISLTDVMEINEKKENS